MAIKDTLIHNTVSLVTTSIVSVRDSSGILYSLYRNGNFLYMSYSTNSGSTWTEVSSSIYADGDIAMCIDNTDTIHVIYAYQGSSVNTPHIYYKTFYNFTWSETTDNLIALGYGLSSNSGNPPYLDIAIDSLNIPHVVYIVKANSLGSNYYWTYYITKVGGIWPPSGGQPTLLSLPNASTLVNAYCKIVIDSNNNKHVVWLQQTLGSSFGQVVKYTTAASTIWSSPTTINSLTLNAGSPISLAVDINNNLHLCYTRYVTPTTVLLYAKFTASSGTWTVDNSLDSYYSGLNGNNISVFTDSTEKINIIYKITAGTFKLIQYSGGVWSSPSNISTVATCNITVERTTIFPIIAGINTNMNTAGYQFTYCDSGNNFRFYSSDDINFPAPLTQNYSHQASATLSTTSVTFTTPFTSQEYSDVLTIDSNYASQTAVNQYALIGFKNKGTSPSAEIHVIWTGKTDIAPSTSTVYLQIFNNVTLLWETLTSDSGSDANSDFTLAGSKTTGLTSYYDAGNWVTCRVYQLAQ